MRNSRWQYTYLQTTEDRLWFDEGMKRNWHLPTAASSLRRWWGIRHLRSMFVDLYVLGLGVATTDYEDWVEYAKWKGWV